MSTTIDLCLLSPDEISMRAWCCDWRMKRGRAALQQPGRGSVIFAEAAFKQNELEFSGENVRHQSADTGVEPCGTESY